MVNPRGPTAEAIAAELGPRSPLVMEKAPQPVQGIRDPYRFPLDIGADAHASNQRNVKALQHANKTGLLPGLASTAWQTGDRGKAEVVDLFHQVAAADAKGGSRHTRNLEERFLPMIPKEDRGLFWELRARKEERDGEEAATVTKNEKPKTGIQAESPRAGGTSKQKVAQSGTIRDALEGDPDIDHGLVKQAIKQRERELDRLIRQRDRTEAEIENLREQLKPSKFGEFLRKFSENQENHRDYYEEFKRVPPVPRREGSPPEMEVPDSMLESDVVQESIFRDIQNALKEHAKIQKRINKKNAELERLQSPKPPRS